MTEYLSAAETAKVVRKILKEQFPGIKFSVRSETYSMGNNVRVHWTDGPTTKQVDQAVGVLSGSGFDGMIDLKYNIYHWLLPDGSFTLAKSQGSQGSGGMDPGFDYPKPHPDARLVSFADHISPSRSFSREFLQKIVKAVSAKFSGPVPTIEGEEPYAGLRHAYTPEGRDLERTYWTILSSSEIRPDGEIVCHDYLYGQFVNKAEA